MPSLSYSTNWDTLAIGALRTVQDEASPIDYVPTTWRQFYKILLEDGCFRSHPEEENVHKYVCYQASEAVTEFMPDEVLAGNLSTTANDPMTKTSATFVARTQNINFAQGIRGLKRPSYALERVKADVAQLADNIEMHLSVGSLTATSPTAYAPFIADTGWSTRKLMSLKGLYHLACDLSATGANISGADNGADRFQGVVTDDVNGSFVNGSARAQPYFFVTADASGGSLLDDVDLSRMRARWGGRPNRILTSEAKYQQFHTLHKTKAALPQVPGANLGIPTDGFMYGDCKVSYLRQWSAADADWDPRTSPAAIHPMFGLNTNAYRVWTWAAMGQKVGKERGFDWLSYANDIGGGHPTTTASFRRIEGYLQAMFMGMRGSLFQILGYT